MKKFYFVSFVGFLLSIFLQPVKAQITVNGTLTDITKYNAVENATVVCTNGNSTTTDSLGRYRIAVGYQDSIYFVYNNKPTQKFPVTSITRPELFEVSLKVPIVTRYKVLNEVVVVASSYRQDSIENRMDNYKYFDYKKPGLSSTLSPTGMAGADLNELINIFRFKRNKRLAFLQNFLEEQEEERFVNFKFSKKAVKRITNLDGPALDTFLVWYRPTYTFASTASELTFNDYVLRSLYQFRRFMPLGIEAKKED